jgi:PAS domain S-box-containing protein
MFGKPTYEELVKKVTFLEKELAERRHLEETLRNSEEKFRFLAEKMADIVWTIDRDFRTTYVSPSIEKVLGFTPEERKQQSLEEMITPDSLQKVQEMFLRELQRDEEGTADPDRSVTIEIEYCRKDGASVWMENIVKAIRGPGGEIIGMHGVSRDITERKIAEKEKTKLQSQLRQAHKMEAIGTLTGGIAHDFNNILGIIIGNTELALDDVPEWNPAHFNLEEIKTAVLRAKGVVSQLLGFIRKTDIKRQPIHIIPVIKDSLKFLRSTITTNIDIRQNIQNTTDTVHADSTQIHQLIINLCTNASQAMDETGGILDIGIQNVVLDENSASVLDPELITGNYVKVTVSDTGHGIAPEIIQRIFDPYFTTREVGKGSGLGLSVVHGIVKSHKGAISVDSRPGKGTSFSVFFPVTNENVAIESKTVEELPAGNERILFVDDEISIVNTAKQILERLGYRVETKMSPVKALAIFRSNPDEFDLVITDMAMPQMTGDRLVKEILNIRPEMPVILCTGFSEKISEEKAKALGIKAFALKPLVKTDFAVIVRKVMDEG